MANSKSDKPSREGNDATDKPESRPVLYEKVEPFTREKYEALGLSQIERPFGFAARTRAVPITVNEFAIVSRFFPIIFAGATQYMPIAVLGLSEDRNLFIDETGDWERFVYIPSYIRRYPFISATDEKEKGRMTLCIAADAPMVTDKPEHPFFENGELSGFTKESLEFCKILQQQFDNTKRFVDLLNDLDLLASREASVTPPGADKPQPLASFIAVDEEKLNALRTDKLGELHQSGALSAIYAHLHSTLNWQALTMRQEAAQARA